MAADANAPVESLDQDLDRIIAELDAPFGHLPTEAIRAAQSNRDRIIPRLMQSLDGVVQTIQQDEKRKTNGAFFALLLLIEFRAAEAFDTIVRVVSLPGDLPSRLFGDALHGSSDGLSSRDLCVWSVPKCAAGTKSSRFSGNC